MIPLPKEFYLHDDVILLAKNLLGKWLITEIDGEQTGGMIIETEAYKGPEDRACHAYKNRRTKRTEVMFHEGGIAYVYFCYGMHHLFNIVTSKRDKPHAILVRALLPDIGLETMRKRRKIARNLTSGPGMVCQALGIDRTLNGASLQNSPIWIEDRGFTPKEAEIDKTPRIGIAYAKEDALLPWRFLLNHKEKSRITLN